MTLPMFLEAAGYRRIALSRNGVGHFEASGTLAGCAVRVLIDKGAASTVVSFSLAQELGLKLTAMGRVGGGAGAAQLEVFELHDAELKIGDVRPRTRALYALMRRWRSKGQRPWTRFSGWTFLRTRQL